MDFLYWFDAILGIEWDVAPGRAGRTGQLPTQCFCCYGDGQPSRPKTIAKRWHGSCWQLVRVDELDGSGLAMGSFWLKCCWPVISQDTVEKRENGETRSCAREPAITHWNDLGRRQYVTPRLCIEYVGDHATRVMLGRIPISTRVWLGPTDRALERFANDGHGFNCDGANVAPSAGVRSLALYQRLPLLLPS